MLILIQKSEKKPKMLNQKQQIMQNEPNFQNDKMNVTAYMKKDYDNICLRERRENEPNSNPIKPNFEASAYSLTGPNPYSLIHSKIV